MGVRVGCGGGGGANSVCVCKHQAGLEAHSSQPIRGTLVWRVMRAEDKWEEEATRLGWLRRRPCHQVLSQSQASESEGGYDNVREKRW